MRPAIALALFLICAYIGCIKPAKLKKRAATLEELERDVRRLGMLMEHRRLPIEELIGGLDSPVWAETARLAKGGDTPLFTAWLTALERMTGDGRLSCLDGADMAVLLDFGDALGVSFMEAQTGNTELTVKRLEERRQAANAELKRKERVFRSLGILGGAAAALMVI